MPAIRTAERLDAETGSATMEFSAALARIRARGVDVVDLAGGDPDFDTPVHVVEEAVRSLRAGRTHYGPAAGVPALREAIARSEAGPDRKPDDVLVTASAKYALFVALQAVLDPGDEVIVLTPGWVSYGAMVRLHGAVPVEVPLDASSGYRIDIEQLRYAITPRTKAVILNTPSNPTGRVCTADELARLCELARQFDLVLVSDEVYARLVFQGEHVSPAAIAPERTIVINGLSKSHAMTGWRLGWLAGPPAIVRKATIVYQHTMSCTPTFVQDAAVAALTGPQSCVTEMTERYRLRRDRVCAALQGLPDLSFARPQGAFYVLLDVDATGRSGAAVSAALIEQAGVALLPGGGFGHGWENHLRLSFATPDDRLDAGIERLSDAWGRISST
ncbi:pyridoxal phosphate-dependent aminotransferase [Microbacterium sp. 18062]|uniref:pyridoxal phosphate-dependent aminotransferase n=1 Tax=Microbacterium sp. 18062 TaxID=2681410 RepID=UPI00135B8975|nr:pyridoxal phosphate-dependent aminotransferase [Microbacterium sp. 18062]